MNNQSFGYAWHFGIHKTGSQKSIKSKTLGNLLLDGKEIKFSQPFAVLQAEKSKLIKQGINKNRLKIVSAIIYVK